MASDWTKTWVLFELQTWQFFTAPLCHLRAFFRAQCVQLPLRTQDRFVSLETGSEDTTLSMQCYQGLRPVIFFCNAGCYDNSFTAAMNESRKVRLNFPGMTGKLFLSEGPRLDLLGRKGGRVWTIQSPYWIAPVHLKVSGPLPWKICDPCGRNLPRQWSVGKIKRRAMSV